MTLRILAIDDDLDTIQLIHKILEGAGYDFTGAITGEEGLALAIATNFDLIVLDIDLPDLQGDEIAKRIKQSVSTPILALTGQDRQGDRERFLDAGCDGYLAKPISRPYLLTAIQELV